MEIKWTPSARQSLRQTRSIHFTEEETKRYKAELVRKIEQKVALLLEAMRRMNLRGKELIAF